MLKGVDLLPFNFFYSKERNTVSQFEEIAFTMFTAVESLLNDVAVSIVIEPVHFLQKAPAGSYIARIEDRGSWGVSCVAPATRSLITQDNRPFYPPEFYCFNRSDRLLGYCFELSV